MNAELLEILRCPVSRQALRIADQNAIARINAEIAAANLKREDGEGVLDALDAALISDDESLAYPIRGGLPVLLASEVIRIGNRI